MKLLSRIFSNTKTMSKIVLDTNVILRLLVQDEENSHFTEQSARLFEKIINGDYKAKITALICAEIIWVLSSFYKIPKKKATLYLERLLQTKNVKVEESTDVSKALAYYKNHNIKFTDALILSAVLENEVLCTFDRELQGLTEVKVESPAEMLY